MALAYCRIHRATLFLILVSAYYSYLHSFQMHPLRHRDLGRDLVHRPDVVDHQLLVRQLMDQQNDKD